MSKNSEVRARRAYFDTRFGQLHVRTAFPGSGGFDEHTTLLCIHALSPAGTASSRTFAPFLELIAADRSVYAPDRPGCGESDGSAGAGCAGAHAHALFDLAADLRLRKIDLLGLEDGCDVAVEMALSQTERVRRVVLAASHDVERASAIKQPTLLLRLERAAKQPAFPADAFTAHPALIAAATSAFLNQR